MITFWKKALAGAGEDIIGEYPVRGLAPKLFNSPYNSVDGLTFGRAVISNAHWRYSTA